MTYSNIIFSKLLPKLDYKRLINIEISKSRLLHNLSFFQQLNKNIKISPVLKSNAYGHGLILVAKILDKKNLPFFILDSYYESLILRKNKIKTPILIIGYTFFENIAKNKQKNIIFTITSLKQLQEISKRLNKKVSFHLKIDTGMHRQGILYKELKEALRLIKLNKNIIIQGICSHLAEAEDVDSVLTKEQIELWNKAVNLILHKFRTIKYYHLTNTAGSINKLSLKQNVSRIGLGLYGIDFYRVSKLRPVLIFKTFISGFKSLEVGDKVGYNGTFKADSKKVIATIPTGYYEGINRKLSNKGYVYIKDTNKKIFCPILGNVSMNITIIDVSRINNIKLNQEVVVVSNNSEDLNSVLNMAKLAGILPYEILVQIPDKIKRILVD